MKLADQLASLKAQIAALESQSDKIKKQIIANGGSVGDDFTATIVTSSRENLDMDAVRAKLSPQFIAAHTRHYDVVSVRVSANQKLAA